jgi:zinc-binding alcohol dehydrogenase/oxidoreductase
VLLFPGVRWAPGVPGPEYRIDGDPWCVLGVPHQGTHAELIVAAADLVRPKPAGWSWEEAAALPLAGLTAWRALVTRGGLRGGSAILITGAGSGVSTFLIQIAVALGARVLVTTSSEAKLARARELGAEGGADYRDPGWPKRIRELAPDGVDLVVDSARPRCGRVRPRSFVTEAPSSRWGERRAATLRSTSARYSANS